MQPDRRHDERTADPGPRTRVAVLGSTGSIGRQSLDVLAALADRFVVTAMAAGRDRETFQAQMDRFEPRVVSLADHRALAGLDLPAGTVRDDSPDAMERMATRDDVDLVVVGTGGIVSLRPVLAALGAGKVVATANKETLVAGGHLVMPLARRRAAEVAARSPTDALATPLAWLRPIDSEHSAIWQCLVGERIDEVRRLLLTGSGGPFRETSAEGLSDVSAADALAHPTWRMGGKISIDSATLMNKGLEVIEAHWLYDVPYERICVMIHPQSVVHSLVEFLDGSVKAQLGLPDMRIPIQYALSYPRRLPSRAEPLELTAHAALTFEEPDVTRFPALRIAREAALAGPRAASALIAADEVAVARFLGGSLDFLGIPRLVGAAVERFGGRGEHAAPALDELLALDVEVRRFCTAGSAGASA
ncbi:1-deoxy-D-xylulose-5-phosphate reductoisomerase [soil metagenome]